MFTAGVNEPVKIPFLVTDVDGITPVTGLLNAAFTKTLILEDAVSAQPVVVSEVGSGYYTVEFTPNDAGRWYLTVTTPFQDVMEAFVEVGEYDPLKAVALLQKTAVNRLEVDLTAQELVLYDDDGTTTLQRWPLESDEGPPTDPVTTQPGVQTKRKAPIL